MCRTVFVLTAAIILVWIVAGCQPQPRPLATPTLTPIPPAQVEVIAEGLLAPIGLALTPEGALLVAEIGTTQNDYSGGVTLITPDGRMGRLISGIYSTRDSGDPGGVNGVALSPDGDKLYVAAFMQDGLLVLDVDGALVLPAEPFTPDDLELDLRPLNYVKLINPFAIVFTDDGVPVVTDASGNGLAIRNPDGTVRFFHRFDPLPVPERSEHYRADAVPTGLARWEDDEFLVALFSGCPYATDGGKIVAVDMHRNQRTLVGDLTMPIDVEVGPNGELYIAEFAVFEGAESECMTDEGYQPDTARISVFDGGQLHTLVDGLSFIGSILLAPDGSIYATNVFQGTVLRIYFANE